MTCCCDDACTTPACCVVLRHHFVARYVSFLRTWKLLFVLLWVGAAAAGGAFLVDFLDSTSSDFNPPDDSAAAEAQRNINRLFRHGQANHDVDRFSVVVEWSRAQFDRNLALLQSSSASSSCPLLAANFSLGSHATFPLFEKFVADLTTSLKAKAGDDPQRAPNSSSPTNANEVVQVISYFRFVTQLHAPLYAQRFLAPNGEALLVPVLYHYAERDFAKNEPTKKSFANFLASEILRLQRAILQDPLAIEQILKSSSSSSSSFESCPRSAFAALATSLSAEATGMTLMAQEMIRAGKKQYSRSDAIVVPLALFVMALTVRSLRLLILPMLGMGVCLVCSMGLSYPIALKTPITTGAPSLMMSLAIATAVDANLFLLSRFVEEIRGGHKGSAAVRNMLKTAGGAIALSNATFIFSFVALIFFPNALIRSYGITNALTIVVSLLISLNLTPSLLLTFPAFFEESAKRLQDTCVYRRFVRACCCSSEGDGANDVGTDDDDDDEDNTNNSSHLQSPLRGFGGGGGGDSEVDGFSTMAVHGGGPVHSATASMTTIGSASRQGSKISPRPSGSNFSGALYFDSQVNLSPGRGNNSRASFEGGGIGGGVGADASSVGGGSAASGTGVSSVDPRGGAAYFEALLGESSFANLACVLRFPMNAVVIVAILGLVGACGWQAWGLRVTDDMMNYLPRVSEQRDVVRTIENNFGFAVIEPYHLAFILADSPPVQITDAANVALCQQVLQHIAHATATPLHRFRSIFWMNGTAVAADELQQCIVGGDSSKCDPNIRVQLTSSLNYPQNTAFLVDIDPPVDPVGVDGKAYYHTMQHAAAWRPLSKTNASSIRVEIAGMGPASVSAMDAIYTRVSYVAIATCGAVLLVVGIGFKSVVVPLRVCVSIACTEFFVFGVSVLVWQRGALDWTTWGSLQRADASSWLAPIVVGIVTIGVAADMDMLFLTRAAEIISREAVSTADGTLLALCATAKTITAAGSVLAVAFFGLVFSDIRILNEMGLGLCVAVLFDTFIVRTLLVPAIMSVLGRWHWWPTDLEAERFAGGMSGSGAHAIHDMFSDTRSESPSVLFATSAAAAAAARKSEEHSGGGAVGSSANMSGALLSATRSGPLAKSPRESVTYSRHRLEALHEAGV